MINHVIVVHLHELTLKKKNRSWFEKILLRNIKIHLSKLDYINIQFIAGRIIITGIDNNKINEYREALSSVIGIRNYIIAKQTNLDIEQIKKTALSLINKLDSKKSFRITARRQNKNFILNSQEINIIIGEYIIKNSSMYVNLNSPDYNIIIEIVNDSAYLGCNKVPAFGGLPVGSGENALSLISSGIDSPVASFNILKRGVKLDYIHFHSSPATNRQSVYNVERIVKVLCKYQLDCTLYLFPLLEIQNKIMELVDSKFWIIMFRRAMMKIASSIAKENNYKVLVTGDNIGQVASQTLSNIVAIQESTNIPIIRPLSGFNKEDIVNQAVDIGTYDISIEPYEDCCSYFLPPNPETKANLKRINIIENKINLNTIVDNQLNNMERKKISYYE